MRKDPLYNRIKSSKCKEWNKSFYSICSIVAIRGRSVQYIHCVGYSFPTHDLDLNIENMKKNIGHHSNNCYESIMSRFQVRSRCVSEQLYWMKGNTCGCSLFII